MGEIAAWKVRDVEKLYHLEDEAGITQKELADLENRKIVAKKEERGKIAQIRETKRKSAWRIEFAIREIEKG